MNHCLVSGRIERDPAYTVRNGLSICRLQLRVERKRRRDGQLESFPFDLEVSAFGGTAERASSSLLRGTKVTVRGRLDPYEAKDGKLRMALIADELEWESA